MKKNIISIIIVMTAFILMTAGGAFASTLTYSAPEKVIVGADGTADIEILVPGGSDPYAGVQFELALGEGVAIENVSFDKGNKPNIIRPTEARGSYYFSLFAGTNAFSGDLTCKVTISYAGLDLSWARVLEIQRYFIEGPGEVETTTDSTQSVIVVHPAPGEGFALSPGYMMLINGESGELTPILNGGEVPDGTDITWTSGNPAVATVSDGEVTAEGAGSCYITAAITLEGRLYKASSLVDVVDNTPAGKLDMGRAQLAQTSVTVSTRSSIGAKVGLVYETKVAPLSVPSPTTQSVGPVTMDGYSVKLLNTNGRALTRAVENEIRAGLDFKMADDRTVLITRKAGANFSKLKNSYKVRLQLEHEVAGHTVTIPGTLTVKIDKKAPPIKAGTHKFNTFFDDQNLKLNLTSTKGKILSVKSANRANPIPNWITLNDDMTITLNSKAYNAYKNKPKSGKAYLSVTVQGYDPVNYTLTVRAARAVPGLKLSSSSVTVIRDASRSQGIPLKLQPKSKKNTLTGLGVTDLRLSDDVFEIKDFNPATGDFTLAVKSAAAPKAKTLTLRADINGTGQLVPLTLKTKLFSATKVPAIKASPATVSLNPSLGLDTLGAGIDVRTVRLTPSPADLNVGTLAQAGNITVKRSGAADAKAELDIVVSPDGRGVTVRNNADTRYDVTYTVTIVTDELYGAAGNQKKATASLKVKTPKASRSDVTAKLTVRGKLDAGNPNSAITVTPAISNHGGTLDDSHKDRIEIRATTGKNKTPVPNAHTWFSISSNGSGGFVVSFDNAAWKAGLIRPDYTYSIRLIKGTKTEAPGTGEVKNGLWFGEKPLKSDANKAFSVTRGKVKLTRAPTTATLYKAHPHSSSVVTVRVAGRALPESAHVTVSNANYEVRPLGGGKYAISYKNHKAPRTGGNIKLNVFLEGNHAPPAGTAPAGVAGYKANGSVTVKISLK